MFICTARCPAHQHTHRNRYHCPVFITSLRGGTFVYLTNVRMDADDNEQRWILAGAAMLLTEE